MGRQICVYFSDIELQELKRYAQEQAKSLYRTIRDAVLEEMTQNREHREPEEDIT